MDIPSLAVGLPNTTHPLELFAKSATKQAMLPLTVIIAMITRTQERQLHQCRHISPLHWVVLTRTGTHIPMLPIT